MTRGEGVSPNTKLNLTLGTLVVLVLAVGAWWVKSIQFVREWTREEGQARVEETEFRSEVRWRLLQLERKVEIPPYTGR